MNIYTPPIDATHVSLVNIISYVGHSSSSYDLWVIPDPLEVESFGASMLLYSTLFYAMIQSVG